MRRVAAALAVLLFLAPLAPAQTPESRVAEALRVEWKPVNEGAAIAGYVYNDSQYRIGLVRLRLSTRDDPGQQPGQMLAWVHGNVPARGRWDFSVRVPQNREVVEVTIESFSLIALEAPGQSP